MLRFNSPGDIHFVTFKTSDNYPYFSDEKCCLILLEELVFYRNKLGLKIYGYVILSDHVHCLIYFEDLKLTISKIIQVIKGSSARRIIDLYSSSGSQEHLLLARNDSAEQMLCATPLSHNNNLKYRIWQPRFYDFNIYSQKKFDEKLQYIHNNPIKHGITNNISQYKYCSWRNYELGDQSIFKIDFLEQ